MEEIIIEQIMSNPNSGKPLPPQIKYELEGRLKVDLSGIKVYSGPETKMFLMRIGADAFVKDNAVFMEAEFDNSKLKQVLLERHELTHSLTR